MLILLPPSETKRAGGRSRALDLARLALPPLTPQRRAVIPAPVALSAYLRVVTQGPEGAVRALNHFNKHEKGALVRRLAHDRPRIASRAGFVRWADAAGLRVQDGAAGELRLFA